MMMTCPLSHMLRKSEDQEVGVSAVGSRLGQAILMLQNGPPGIDGELAGALDQSGHRGTIIVLAQRRSQYRDRIRRGIGGRRHRQASGGHRQGKPRSASVRVAADSASIPGMRRRRSGPARRAAAV